MGRIAKELKKNFLIHLNKKVIDISVLRETKREVEKSLEAFKSIREDFDSEKSDLLHCIYSDTFALVSFCMYGMSHLKEMTPFKKISNAEEHLYMSGGPPTTPLTDSYYQYWESFDLTFGPDKETLGSVFTDLADILKISQDELGIIENLNSSRMGVYKICKKDNKKILLKEFVTNDEFWCVCPSEHDGAIGELWFARILPPLSSFIEYINYSVVLTTPYVLLNSTEADWNDFFLRNKVDKNNYHNFMKFGPSMNYWHEFVFYGYFNYIKEAVFLSGIPDKESTLPHHENFTAHDDLLRPWSNGSREEQNEKDKKLKLINTPKKTSEVNNSDKLNLGNNNNNNNKEDRSDILKGRKASEVFLEYAMLSVEQVQYKDASHLPILELALRIPWCVWNACVWEDNNKKFHLSK